MEKINLQLENKRYPIYFSEGKKGELAEILSSHFSSKRWVVVTNTTVEKIYGKWIREELSSLGELILVKIPEGERFKLLSTVEKIYQALAKAKVDRHTPMIALGGGVVGDVAGFAAATYLRGIPLIQIPTTLLAQVDSSVGGKTGVDLSFGKNLVGAFYQPHLVYIDVSKLKTLPPREVLCGTAEVIKYGVIQSSSLFDTLEKKMQAFLDLDPPLVKKIVKECVQIKANIVEQDEKETTGLRATLNYGHTLGHAIETLTQYRDYNHGEAVAIGMAFAARLAQFLDLIDSVSAERIINLIHGSGLPYQIPRFSKKAYLQMMSRDKKMKAGKIQYVLPEKIGQVCLKELELDFVGDQLLEYLREE
ncbi:MAG: 3-dehydroquinate synthase [Deltaproteobacteria bacterium]|nr:3-dehydroquinate synthase [Deltaproteobacteria bacterium]